MWGVLNWNSIIFYAILGIVSYFVAKYQEDLKTRIKDPKWFGLTFPIMSFFEVGVAGVFTLALYALILQVIIVWEKKLKVEEYNKR